MDRVVAGATGLIGKRLVNHWLKQGHTVTVIGRSLPLMQKTFGRRVRSITWDQLSREVIESAEVVVNLAGVSVGGEPWIEARKQAILNSRVETTTHLANILAAIGKQAPPLFNASAIGIYGLAQQLPDQLPQNVDENTTFDWDNPPDFLSLVGRRWEEAAERAIKSGVRVVFLRFAVVLAKEGGALPQIMTPFRYYLGGRVGTGCQPFSWVSIDDVIRAIDFLLAQPQASGPFNIVAPECVMQKNFAETLGRVMGRPALLPTPRFVLQYLLGLDMARELLLEGQHVYPQRLLDLGFHFSYPDLESALNHILK